ncbi:hypothetical protein CLIM01_07561 [Colletotrichum limetticola]|uniref:Zn(2)-C6 fungal-type domain-containing protein n=1 Tax=Colletotrichum limetticola TaxID=1209924 RepID=A0ABQ9PU64_9PEZI|nr:hypothetical protein CLIM01_07561 [Colletotrichum limetticola]
MAEALLGLTPSYGSASRNKPSIAHPDDIPAQLRRELDRKKTPTRCEHLSVTLEVPSTLEFAIRDSDSDVQENIDSALSGLRTQVVEGQTVKIIRTYDTIISQPHDNPMMQRAVAKHIVGLLSVVDESTWVVREVSRGQYGWSFTYNCKDSLVTWNRQHQKTPNKIIIGEYSQKELEPEMQARPAFDCRGTLTVAFSKNTRTINVKYEHTPLHKTLGEMIEHFKPLPPAAPPAPLIPAGEKSKKAKTPRKRKSEALKADGTPVEPKPKRKRKSEALNPDGTPIQPKKRKRKSEAAKDAQAAGDTTNGEATTTVQTKADAAVQSGVHSHAVLNVPPGEAARRREVAIRLLSDSGLDPESLSTEQFSIFANQSPDLQKESLAMLVKYGAERLRIVHPNDAAASSTSASPTPQQGTAQAAVTTATLESPASAKKKKRPRKSKAAEDAEEVELFPAPPGTPMKLISRGGCIACRRAKAKVRESVSLSCLVRETNVFQCDRAKPECASCEEQGVECQYPLINKMPPKKKEERSADVVEDEEDDDDAEAEVEAETEPAEPGIEVEEQEPDDIETIDYTSNMPVANMLTPAEQAPSQDYFNDGPNEMTYTHSASNDMNMSHGVSSYPEPSATATYAEQQAVSTSFSQPSPTGTATYTQPSTDANSYTTASNDTMSSLNYSQPSAKSPRATRISSRRSLPSGPGQPHQPTAESPVPLPSYAQNCQSISPPRTANTVSPTMTTKQHKPRSSTQMPAATTVAPQETSYRNTQQAVAHVAAQQQRQHRPSPTQQAAQVVQTVTPAQVSPFQAPVQAARTKSRAGQRASTRTPVNEPRATPSHHTVQPSTSATMDSATYNDTQSLSNYNNYNTKHSSQSNNSTELDTTRLAYQPYAAQNTSATTSTYPSYDYDRTGTTAHTSSNNTRSGQLYNNQSQSRNAQSYNNANTDTAAVANTYAQQPSTNQQQSSSLQSFNMRSSAASSTQPRSSSRNANQQPQQQQSQSQPQQTQSYGSYANQTQQQSTQPDQHNWYGFGSGSNTSFTPANVAGGYATRGATSANYGSGSSTSNQAYQQQHGSLNMTSHSYSPGDNEMYELLKNSLHGPGR